MKRIFISCVTREFESLRIEIYKALRTGYEVDFQESFAFEPTSLKQTLLEKLKRCDGIIHIVGDAYGTPFPADDPEGNPDGNISYTQWELRMVEHLNSRAFRKKKIWLIFPGPGCTRDTPVEWLDWVENPELPPEEAAAIQQSRRDLQAAYRESLLARRSTYAYRRPANDFECKDVIASIVRKEKRSRNLLALTAAVLLTGAIGAGYLAIDHLKKEAAEKDRKQRIGNLEETCNGLAQAGDAPAPYYYNREFKPAIAASFRKAMDTIRGIDPARWEIWAENFQALAAKDDGRANPGEDYDRLLAILDTSAPDLAREITRATIGFAFRRGHHSQVIRLLKVEPSLLPDDERHQGIFEAAYQSYKKSGENPQGDSALVSQATQSIDDATRALEQLSPTAMEGFQRLPERTRLLYAKANLLFEHRRDDSPAIESALGDATAAAEELEAMDNGLSGFYRGLCKTISGRLLVATGGQSDEEASQHYVDAFNLLQGESDKLFQVNIGKTGANPWSNPADSILAATERGRILSELSQLFGTWSEPLLNTEIPDAILAFEETLNKYGTKAHQEETTDWGKLLARDREAFETTKKAWEKRWNDIHSIFQPYSEKADSLIASLRNAPRSVANKESIDPEIMIDRMLLLKTKISEGKRTYDDKSRAADLAIRKAVELEKTSLPAPAPTGRDLTAIEQCLRELDLPNGDQAKRCIAKLKGFAATPGKDAKEIQDATELANLIENVFIAEMNLRNARGGILEADKAAAEKENTGREWLRPNGLGRVNHEFARRCFLEAQALRLGARERLDAATNAMTEQIRQTALAAKLYDDKQRKRGAAVLSGLAHASIARAAIEYDGPIVLSKREADEIKNDGKLND